MVTSLAPVPQLDPAWIRSVLFEHGIDDWVDCAVDPATRHWAGRLFADQVEAAYLSWKWWSGRSGLTVDDPPPDAALPQALDLAVASSSWPDLVCAAATVGLAQSLLFAELADTDDAGRRRTFTRPAGDAAHHADQAFAFLASGPGLEPDAVMAPLSALVQATAAWLDGLGLEQVAAAWRRRLAGELERLGFSLPV
jgi:hypothetical protein